MYDKDLMKSKRDIAQRNLKFLQRRHLAADYDYLSSLNERESEFLERFSRGFYDGERRCCATEADFKDANQRRYRSKCTDALLKAGSVEVIEMSDNLDPEKIFLILECANL